VPASLGPRRHQRSAFDAIDATLPLGSVAYGAETNANGGRLNWLPRAVVDRLKALRGREWKYNTLGLFKGYRVVRPALKAVPAG
jgi:hypothetical protein